jgi:hypothetical protein
MDHRWQGGCGLVMPAEIKAQSILYDQQFTELIQTAPVPVFRLPGTKKAADAAFFGN